MKAFFRIAVAGLALLFGTNAVWAGVACPLAAAACHGTTANDIVDTAVSAGSFKTLAAALQAAGLVDTLKGNGPFTVFAPTDAAFAKLPKGTLESLLKPENRDKLSAILKYHVVPGNVKLTKALEAGQRKTVLGPRLVIKFVDGSVKVGTASLVTADIAAANGNIHVIDSVLLPPAPPAEISSPAKARKLIKLAIERGVPLFNNGTPDACKAVYEVTAEALLNSPDQNITANSREKLTTALAQVKEQTSARDQAWTLRHALDSVYENLETKAE
jgi:transforming growth factor-beta-induced protein